MQQAPMLMVSHVAIRLHSTSQLYSLLQILSNIKTNCNPWFDKG